MVGFLSFPGCCCGAATVVSDVEPPSCCAKKDAAPDPASDEDKDAPDHVCGCVKLKDTRVPVVLAVPEHTVQGIDVDFPIALENPTRDWSELRAVRAPELELSPPPPIRQMFCVLRL